MNDPNQISPAAANLQQGSLRRFLKRCFLILGIFVVLLVIASMFLPSENRSRPAPRIKSANNLKQIGLAITLYQQDHGGQYPDSFTTILRDEDITPEVFVSPGSSDTPASGPTTQAVLADLTAGGHLSYVYLGRGLSGEPPADTVVAYENPNIWPGGANVLFADVHVEFVETPLLNQIIARAAAGGFPVTMPSE